MRKWERERREEELEHWADHVVSLMSEKYPQFLQMGGGNDQWSLEMFLCCAWDCEWERFVRPELHDRVKARFYITGERQHEARRRAHQERYDETTPRGS